MNEQQKKKAEIAFKKFKKKYFKNKPEGFTGTEISQCVDEFWKQYKTS